MTAQLEEAREQIDNLPAIIRYQTELIKKMTQQPDDDNEIPAGSAARNVDNVSDNGSFHASVWEEERLKRSHVRWAGDKRGAEPEQQQLQQQQQQTMRGSSNNKEEDHQGGTAIHTAR